MCRPTDTDVLRYLKMDIKSNPKLVGNKFLKKNVYSAPEMEEIVWRNMLVTMYRTTRRHIRENVKFGMLFNDAILAEIIA